MLPAALAIVFSCSAPVPAYYGVSDPDNYSRIYISKAFNGDLRINLPEEKPDTTLKIYVNYGGLVELSSPIDVTIGVDASQLDAFNTAHGTEYDLLPESCISTTTRTVTIPAGETNSTPYPVTISGKDLPGRGPFVLPVSILTSSPSVPVNEDLRTLFVVVSQEVDLTKLSNYDRAGWSILSCSSYTQVASENTPPELVLDGDFNTFWGTAWTPERVQPPHELVIDMKQEHMVHGLAFRARIDAVKGQRGGLPKEIDVAVSSDAENWLSAGHYIGSFGAESSLLLDKWLTGRYVRLTIQSCYGTNASSEFYQAAISEMNIF